MKINYQQVQQYLSASRMLNYEAVCGGNTDKAFKLYNTNLRISQAFYPLLSLTEVILRNAINDKLATHFADFNWLTNQQLGFMSHPSLSYFDRRAGRMKHNHFLKNQVAKSILDARGAATQGKIIADLNFGFWTALFDNTHYSILTGVPIQIYSNLPPGGNRNNVHQTLVRIRDFRNRVYHNEPLIFEKDPVGYPLFSLTSAKSIYQDIQDIFLWLDLDFTQWTKSINNIIFEIERAECIMKVYPSNKYYFYRLNIGFKHYRNKYSKS